MPSTPESGQSFSPSIRFGIHGSFECHDLLWFPAPDDELRFYYLPLRADSQRGADGKPASHLLVAGNSAFLQISTVWDVSAPRLEGLRRAIATRLELDDPALVRLAFAPVTVDAVRLMAGDGLECDTELARVRSSGLAPNSALFSLSLRGEERARATAAFNGRLGFLQVRYDAFLTAPVRHVARLMGELSNVRDRESLEAALGEARAVLNMDAADLALREAFLARAVGILLALGGGPEDGNMEIEIELTIPGRIDLSISTDVGTWFEAGDAPVLPIPGPGFDPDPEPKAGDGAAAEVTVTLHLEGVGGVVELVEVSLGDERGYLAAPDFAPVSLRCNDPAGPLRIRTTYASGGTDFSTDCPLPGDAALALRPNDMGLIEVILDAGQLTERGLTNARVTLSYRPRGPGQRETRTVHLRQAPFRARCLLISRGEPLGESLTYDLRATLASGERLRHRPRVAQSPIILLDAVSEED